MTAHTPGRLVVGELNGHGIEIKHTHGDVPGAISLVLARVTARPTWIAEAEANARRLAACWNACEGMPVEHVEALVGVGTMGDLVASLRADARAIEANYEAARARADWLQRMHTLHRAVEMLYVVDGYLVTLTWDGTPISPDYHGETLDAAIDKAMAEFDAEARPNWIGRQGEPALIEEELAAARALLSAVLKESDANIAAIEKAGGFVDAPPLTERIRAFLKGGAK